MKLHYDITGSGPLTVVLTHGLAASGETWRAIVERLAPHYRVLTWDLRGHGRSRRRKVRTRFPTWRPICSPCSMMPGSTVRSSWGTPPVASSRCSSPSTIRSALRGWRWWERQASATNARTTSTTTWRDARPNEAWRRRTRHWDSTRRPSPRSPRNPLAFGHVARAMAGLLQQPLTARLGAIDVPTFICVGDKDFLGVGGSVILSRNIKGSQPRDRPRPRSRHFPRRPATASRRCCRAFSLVSPSAHGPRFSGPQSTVWSNREPATKPETGDRETGDRYCGRILRSSFLHSVERSVSCNRKHLIASPPTGISPGQRCITSSIHAMN